MADLTLTVTNRTIAFPQTVPQQITNTEYIDRVKFDCDSEYSGYSLVAIFKNGVNGKVFPVAVPADRGFVDIDPRALRRKGYLYIGMYGLNGLKVLPTLWATPIEIKEGVDTLATEDPSAPVPSVYAALVARVDALETAVDDIEEGVEELADRVEDVEAVVEELVDDVETLATEVEGKQDTIADLDTIRSGAAAGATALQSVPIATSSAIGGGKVNTVQGIGVKPDGTFYAESASNANIANRNNGYRPIVSTNMDTAFRTCITNPAQELTDEQKAAACATIGAVRIGGGNQWNLERTIYCDGSQSQYIVDGLNARALYYTIHSNVATGNIQVRAYCTINEQSKLVHYHWLAANSGTVMRKSIGRVIREGNMYFSIYASWATNTNSANLNVCYIDDMNDIITEQPITTAYFGGSIIPEGVTINIYTVEN